MRSFRYGGYVAPLRHVVPVLALALLAACSPTRSYETALVLTDIAAGSKPSALKRRTPTPVRRTITYSVAGRTHRADLYVPGGGAPRAGIVLVPGIVRLGNEDPRLIAFAETLARAHFAVLAPDIPDFRKLEVRPADAHLIADAFVYLHSRRDLAPNGRAGIGALSYAVGLSMLAAIDDRVRDNLRFILGIGGYYDINQEITYLSTGYRKVRGHWEYLKPDDYGKLVFVMGSLPYLRDAADRETLKAMVNRKLQDPSADIASLAKHLHSQGRSVYDLVTNSDPYRTPDLVAALPARLRTELAALTLVDKPLHRIRARVILVHGMDDNIVPYTESVELAHALPKGRVQVFLIHHVLTHVELSEKPFLSLSFWTEDIPDFWRMYEAMYAVLSQQG